MIHLLALISARFHPARGAKRVMRRNARMPAGQKIKSQRAEFWCIFREQMHFRSFRFALAIALTILFAPIAACPAHGQGEVPDRDVYQQKAQRIFAFLKQTKWPARKLPGANVPYVVGIYGPDHVSSYLEELIAGQPVKGRAVMVKRLSSKEELGTCHLVYVSGLDGGRVAAALREARHENVLTVGDTPNFTASGGVIQFSEEDGRLGYEVSLANAQRERLELGGYILKISSKQAPRKSSSATAGDEEQKDQATRLANAQRP